MLYRVLAFAAVVIREFTQTLQENRPCHPKKDLKAAPK